MEKVNIKKLLTNTYLVLSGIYVTYSIYRVVKMRIAKNKNSLAKADLLN